MAVSVPSDAAPSSEAPAPHAEATLVIVTAAVLSAAVRAAVGVRAIVARAAGRSRQDVNAVAPVVDAAFDLALRAAAVMGSAGTVLSRLGRAAAPVVLRPPMLQSRLRPHPALAQMVERGRNARENADRLRAQVAGDLVVDVLDEVLDRIDLTQLVLDRVKLSNIIATVDIDDIVARLDLAPIVDRVPIDRIMTRIDLNAIAARLDVNAIAARLDVDDVIARIDLAGIANQVIEEIDLPEIIRESSGAMASETMLGMRIRGIEADQRVNRVIDRLLLRRQDRNTAVPLPQGDGHG